MRDDVDEAIDLWGSVPFIGMHLACLLTIWTGASLVAVVVCLALYGWSHVGWFLCRKYDETEDLLVRDFSSYPELRLLNRFHVLPPAVLAVLMLVLGRLIQAVAPGANTSATQMLVWGFLISTVLVYHGTFMVNSLAHGFGTRRFPTRDDSRNNFLIALITFGEGWHNNHHHAPSSERQGFYWWEIDVSHCILKGLSWCGVVWNLKTPPPDAYGRR